MDTQVRKSIKRFVAGAVLLAAMLWSVPALAQVSLAGNWNPYRNHEDEQDRGPGPDLGDYLGLPINSAARLFAESWDASRLTLQEHQCRVHIAPYIYHGPLALRIWEEKDPETQRVIAIKNYISTYEQTRTIWMDGRPHPSEFAPHTFMGFSTGRWEGRQLIVTTTHLKQGWLRRNGVPESDQATLVERFLRHDKYLTHVAIITDPVYLAEPMIRTTDFQIGTDENTNWTWPCEYVEEISGRAKGDVPHYLPGENPFLKEFVDRAHVSPVAAKGGPESLYPEYAEQLKKAPALSRAEAPRTTQAKNPDTGNLEVLPVSGNVYLLAGGGSNVTVQVGPSGTIMVDSKTGALTDKMLAEIKKLNTFTNKPVRYVLNTSADADHVGGNEGLAKVLGSAASWTIINTPGASQTAVNIYAHDNVSARMNQLPSTAQPTETFVGDQKEFYFNGEPVFMYHIPSAHTDGDSIVFFRHSDVVATGDIMRTDSYPVIDVAKGGNVQGVIDGLNMVLDLAVPAHHEEGGTYIVPGHGRICDEFDVVEYRDMVTIIRDRIRSMVAKKMTLEQIKAARPTLDYDSRYGATTGTWTTDMFVEAVYRSLSKSGR